MLMQIFMEAGTNNVHPLILHSQVNVWLDHLPYQFPCFLGIQITEVALSTTEAQYMFSSLWDATSIFDLIYNFQVISTAPLVFCMVFEDYSGALDLVWVPKL